MNYSPLLALFVRSLREDARSRATYWARLGLGCFLLLYMLIFAAANRGWSNAPGRGFLMWVIFFQIAAITLMGLSYFASAVAEEKEEQTLGLLRMTDLSPLSILLGKSTSRLCGALLLLAAQFPFTIMAVTFGGVSLGQVVASYCAVGAFTFLLCNLALLGSVISRGVAGAAVFCIVIIALLLVSVPLLHGLQWLGTSYFHWNVSFDRVASAIWTATPIARLQEVLGTGYGGGAIGWQFLTNIAFGAGCFLLAWAAFQRFCDREPEAASAPSRVPAVATVNPAGESPRKARVPRTWSNALMWKDFYFLCGGRLGFIVRTTAYGSVLLFNGWSLISKGSTDWTFGINAMSFPLLPFIFSVDVAVMASRIFRTELRDQTFSALAVLPCTMRDIVRDKALACALAAAPGLIASLVLQVLFLVFMRDRSSVNQTMHASFIVQVIAGWLNKTLLLSLIVWLSLYMKRGALPAGFLLSYVANAVISIGVWAAVGALALGFSQGNYSVLEWTPLAVGILGLVAAWAFYLSSIQRLGVLAGED
ncbi:MAG TPA: ABC transporter permease [Chthoniobacter sp.]|nr:ABC transporter permease [Chthoniobacter sp.]